MSRESGVAEVVIPSRSELVGETAFPGMVTSSGDLIVLTIRRAGQNLEDGKTELREGDTLLLRGSWGALDKNLEGPEVLVVDPPDAVRRQAVPLGPGSKRAIAVLVGTVVLLATGAVPAAVASVLGACAMVVLGVLTVEKAYLSISWTTVVLIGAMIAVSTAVKDTGAARQIADALVDVVGGAGPYALLSGLFVLTATLGQLISNTATALIVIPIAVSAANQLDVSPRPVLMRRRRGGCRFVPDARCNPREPDDHGTGRLPVRRLLEARSRTDGVVLRGIGLPRAGGLEVLKILRRLPSSGAHL